ncbi:MAG: type II secretion system protein J [Lachnospira sp.]
MSGDRMGMMKMRKENNRGFSLVEMLVALVISGIILSALAMLLTQSTSSYRRQTILAQLQNEADITLNQIEINVFESSILNIEKTSGGVSLYTQSDGDKLSGYVYDSANETLYYEEDGIKSLVCGNVKDFDVRVNSISIDFDNMTILEIHPNVQVDITIKLEKLGREREVEKSFATRNNLSEKIKFGAIQNVGEGSEPEDDTEDLTGFLKVGDTISRNQYLTYINEN